MAKKKNSSGLLLGPTPAALVSCGRGEEHCIISLAWVGVVNLSPPQVSIAVRPDHYVYHVIKESGEFVINIPSEKQVHIVDGCSTLSGRNVNKFEYFRLSAVRGTLKQAPMIEECPVSMECKLEKNIALDSHNLLIGLVVSSFVDDAVTNEKGSVDFNRCRMLGFCSGNYLTTLPLNQKLGFSLRGDA